MRIVKTYSHLNGLEYLLVHKPDLWNEVKTVIAQIDAQRCYTKESKERRKFGQLKYSPIALNDAFAELLRSRGWSDRRVSYWVTSDVRLIRQTLFKPPEEQREEIQQAGEEAIFSYNQTDFVKERVALEVQFGKYAFVAYDLFVKHLAFYVRDEIDVGIEILPMKSQVQRTTKASSITLFATGEAYRPCHSS